MFFIISSIFAFVLVGATVQQAPADAPVQAPAPTDMTQQNIDCSALSSEMQQFASQLSDANRLVFCNKFSTDQRNTAMDLAGQPDSAGNMMSADMAVQKTAKENNLLSPSQPQSSGGCPVK
ncbi:MAG: hypothetical protein V4494_04845 [Chlamydiota bacterium]